MSENDVLKKDSKKVTIYYSKTEDLVKTMLSLDISGNKFSEELTVIFNNLSECPRYSQQELNLGWNKIHGILPEFLMFFEVGNIGPIRESIKGWSSKITSKCKLFALTDAIQYQFEWRSSTDNP